MLINIKLKGFLFENKRKRKRMKRDADRQNNEAEEYKMILLNWYGNGHKIWVVPITYICIRNIA